MKLKEIEIKDIVYAFKTFKTKTKICEYFGNNGSKTRFIKSLCKKANIDINQYFPKKELKNKINFCKLCGKEIKSPQSYRLKFCSHSCSTTYMNLKRYNFDANSSKENCDNEENYIKSLNSKSKSEIRICKNCGKKFSFYKKQNNKGVFCSHECQLDYRYKVFIEKWKNGTENGLKGEYQLSSYIKRYIFEKNNFSCEKCGCNLINPKSGNSILEIHHIDGDYSNNKEENLQLLCPNCHAMTDNYKHNNTYGRKKRKKDKK